MAATVVTPHQPHNSSFAPHSAHSARGKHLGSVDAVATSHDDDLATYLGHDSNKFPFSTHSPVKSRTSELARGIHNISFSAANGRTPLMSPMAHNPGRKASVISNGSHHADYFGNDPDFEPTANTLADAVPDRFWESMVVESGGPTFGFNADTFDLKAPPPAVPISDVTALTEQLFSAEHLRVIVRNPQFYSRFETYITNSKPNFLSVLRRYRAFESALAALDYADSIISENSPGAPIGVRSRDLEARAKSMVNILLKEALPSYITHQLVQALNETLAKEIVGETTPFNSEIVSDPAEVYCMTDPALPDNPIVYASEDFYRTTRYSPDEVIGRNCRFLQGPKSSQGCIIRIAQALAEGRESCEAFLNYRRDGTSFLNLLMVSPLCCDQGIVRYWIGAQMDVSRLLPGALDSFSNLISANRFSTRFGSAPPKKDSRVAAAELLPLLSNHNKENTSDSSTPFKNPDWAPSQSTEDNTGHMSDMHRAARRYVGGKSAPQIEMWPAEYEGKSGRLPGIFQKYMLVRPYPSLRVIFVSPSLCNSPLQHTKLIDHIGGPPDVRDSVLNTMASGISITANVLWIGHTAEQDLSNPQSLAASAARAALPTPTKSRLGSSFPWHQTDDGSQQSSSGTRSAGFTPSNQSNQRRGSHQMSVERGEPCWIHCTPLLGSDSRVGVWMVLLVDDVADGRRLNSTWRSPTPFHAARPASTVHSDNGSDTQSAAGSRDLNRLRHPGQPSSRGTRDETRNTGIKQSKRLQAHPGPLNDMSGLFSAPQARAQNDAADLRHDLSPRCIDERHEVAPCLGSPVGDGSTASVTQGTAATETQGDQIIWEQRGTDLNELEQRGEHEQANGFPRGRGSGSHATNGSVGHMERIDEIGSDHHGSTEEREDGRKPNGDSVDGHGPSEAENRDEEAGARDSVKDEQDSSECDDEGSEHVEDEDAL